MCKFWLVQKGNGSIQTAAYQMKMNINKQQQQQERKKIITTPYLKMMDEKHNLKALQFKLGNILMQQYPMTF